LVVAQSGVRSGTAGSLVVRSVFQPFEESTFTSFAKAVSGAGDGLSFILSMTPMFHSACLLAVALVSLHIPRQVPLGHLHSRGLHSY